MEQAYGEVFPRGTTNIFARRLIDRARAGDPCRGPYYDVRNMAGAACVASLTGPGHRWADRGAAMG